MSLSLKGADMFYTFPCLYFQYGVMEVINHTTKHKAVLNFKQGGWFGKDLHRIEGFIYDSK